MNRVRFVAVWLRWIAEQLRFLADFLQQGPDKPLPPRFAGANLIMANGSRPMQVYRCKFNDSAPVNLSDVAKRTATVRGVAADGSPLPDVTADVNPSDSLFSVDLPTTWKDVNAQAFLTDFDAGGNASDPSDSVMFVVSDTTGPAKPGTLGFVGADLVDVPG